MDTFIQLSDFNNLFDGIFSSLVILGYIFIFFIIIQPILVKFSIRYEKRTWGYPYRIQNGTKIEEKESELKRRYMPYPIRLWNNKAENSLDHIGYKVLAVVIFIAIIFCIINTIFFFV